MARCIFVVVLIIGLCGCQVAPVSTSSLGPSSVAEEVSAAAPEPASPAPLSVRNEADGLVISEEGIDEMGYSIWLQFTLDGEAGEGLLPWSLQVPETGEAYSGPASVAFTRDGDVCYALVQYGEASAPDKRFRYDPRFDRWFNVTGGEGRLFADSISEERLALHFPGQEWDSEMWPTVLFCYEPVYDLRFISVDNVDYDALTLRETELYKTMPELQPGEPILQALDHVYGLSSYIRYRDKNGEEHIQYFTNSEVGSGYPYIAIGSIDPDSWTITALK